jgi:hypothetical protein
MVAEAPTGTLSPALRGSPVDVAGRDNADWAGLCVSVLGGAKTSSVVLIVSGIARGVEVRSAPVMDGGGGGKSLGRGGISTSVLGATPEVQLEEPDKESDPSMAGVSMTLPLCSVVGCSTAEDRAEL